MVESVGVFGGYEGRAIRWRPDRHGLLCMAVQGDPSSLALYWSFGPNARLDLGELTRPGASRDGDTAARIRDGVTFEQMGAGGRALRSRAWPAVRAHLPPGAVQWRTSGTRLLAPSGGGPEIVGRGGRVPDLAEPWLVVFGHADAGPEDWAVLLTITSRPAAISFGADGLEIELGSGIEDATTLPHSSIGSRDLSPGAPRGDGA